MRVGRIIKTIAAILLLFVCGVALAHNLCDCHHDCDTTPCCYACTHALVTDSRLITFDVGHHSVLAEDNHDLSPLYPEDVFQPPRTMA